MVAHLTEDYVTVAEAAARLRVNQSTIRRWIREGKLPAYRIGERRLALKPADLDRIVSPIRGVSEVGETTDGMLPVNRKLTPEEQRRALEALERAKQHAEEMVARRGGKLFSPSWEILDELRDERTRQLNDLR